MYKMSTNNIFIFLMIVFLVITLSPYYIWRYPSYIYIASLSLMIASFLFTKGVICKEKFLYSIPLFCLVFIYKILEGSNILGAMVIAIPLSILFLIKREWLLYGFEALKTLIALMLIPAILLWGVHHLIDNSILYLGALPYELNPNQFKVMAGFGYALYPFTVVLDNMLLNDFYRLTGPFDEPGVVGTISALILAADRYSFRKKANIILFIAGTLSISLAFYFITFIYYFIISMKRPRILFFLTLFLIGLISVANYNETIKRYTIDRVSVSDGRLSGDNRSSIGLEFSFKKWSESTGSVLFFGVRDDVSSGESSYKQIPIKAGLIGVVVFLSIFLFTLVTSIQIKTINMYLLVFIFLFFISIYQRPDVVHAAFYFIFISGINKNRAMQIT